MDSISLFPNHSDCLDRFFSDPWGEGYIIVGKSRSKRDRGAFFNSLLGGEPEFPRLQHPPDHRSILRSGYRGTKLYLLGDQAR
jgi:hypothetical protein